MNDDIMISCQKFFKTCSACLFDFVGRREIHFKSLLTRRCKTFCFTKLPSTRSPQSHQCLNCFFLTVFIVAVSFLRIPFQLSELVWKLVEEISLQSASKCFPCFGPPANGNKSNAKKSRFRPNQNLTGTIHH